MLKRISPATPAVRLGDASFPHPFPQTLEYSPAARGTWNIVHTGMLVPEAHQIYICAAGCLRGVVLTAAEMGERYRERFSTLELHEEDLYATDNETFLIEGITEILRRLPKLPPAVLVFTACVHHFLGCHLAYVYRTLRGRFPSVTFAECVMDPIRQTKSLTPEERERREIYRLLPTLPPQEKTCNLLGSNLSLSPTSDIKAICHTNGWQLRELSEERSFASFKQEGASTLNLYTNPFSHVAALDIKKRTGRPFLYLPQVWRAEEIRKARTRLAHVLGKEDTDAERGEEKSERALAALRKEFGSRPLALDFTFTFLPLSLARLLVTHGFAVREIYADGFSGDDEENFCWLQQHAPDILLYPTKHPAMRRKERTKGDSILALGQKATYFTGTTHFLPDIEGAGHYGFEAVTWLAHAIHHAATHAQDARPIISRKGWGGPSCL